MKFKVVLASTEPNRNGRSYTEECLKRIASEARSPIPISFNFDGGDPIGVVSELEFTKGLLVGIAEIPRLAVVLGGTVDESAIRLSPDGVQVIHNIQVDRTGLTYEPADTNCTFSVLEEEND